MDIRDLIYFKTIAANGSLVAAATKLNISQPGLSYAIRRLEKELKVELFERGGNNVEINEAGKILLKYAESIIDDQDECFNELKYYANRARIFRLAACDPGPRWYLGNVFSYNYPQLELHSYTYNDLASSIRLLKNGKLDLVITDKPVVQEGLTCKFLARDYIYLSVHPEDNRFDDVKEISLHDSRVVTDDMFFGRGAFSSNFKSKKIALVGLGAIGSMVASSLAHTGVSKIGLWDSDIVEPGNICRSAYTLANVGESKVDSIASIMKSINPFIQTNDVCRNGCWHGKLNNVNDMEFVGGSFYANVNYNSQEEAAKELEGYDLVIDCTGSNEMLHFLSYAASNVDIISMCITNHAANLLCITNKDGNPFELRKAYLSRIEQDTKNFYIEGSGCYSPTFLANNCDIASLVNLALRDINKNMEKGKLMHSSIYSYSDRGIVSDRLSTYKLEDYDICLTVSSETLYDAEDMIDSPEGDIGYLLGAYSRDGKQIMITHIVDSLNAKDLLSDAFQTSKGLIDYIGDYRYSGETPNTFNAESFEIIASKADDPSINTNNPLLAVRNPNGSVTFFLYINNELVRFIKGS